MPTKKPSQKGIDLALKAIKKSWGEGSDAICDVSENYEAIPTGYDDLDSLLTRGAHGLLLGGIIELFGSESSGKCLTKDTYCFTKNGMMTVEEIFEENNVPIKASVGYTEKEIELLNGKQEFEKTSHFYRNGSGSNLGTIKIESIRGFKIEGTHNHPIRVMNKHGYIVWKKLKQITKDDYLCIARGPGIWPADSKVTVQEASLIGFLLSEGTLNRPNRISFTNSDNGIVESYFATIKYVFGNNIDSKIKKNGITYDLNSKELYNAFREKFKMDMVKSCFRKIPSCIMCAGQNEQLSFIRSYFDGEGTFDFGKICLQITSCSHTILYQLQLLLLNFGIFSNLSSRHNSDYDKYYYYLEISGSEALNYLSKIGFNKNNKCNVIKEALSQRGLELANNIGQKHSIIDLIPCQHGILESLYQSIDPDIRNRTSSNLFNDITDGCHDLTYTKLDQILKYTNQLEDTGINKLILEHLNLLNKSKYIFTKVNKISTSKNRTFDFVLPETHSFWSNGFISHNTALAMRAVASAQKMGYPCVWLDAEFGFSPDFARINGVDLDKLIMPELVTMKEKDGKSSIELLDARKVLDLAFDFLKQDTFALCVIDSVAGLMSERVADTETYDPEKYDIGKVANAMSDGLKRLSAVCTVTKSSLILINQLRDQPGKMYADPYHTPGGRAIKFFSKHRISVEKIKSAAGQVKITNPVTNDEEIIGHYARIKIVKNKVAPPVPPDLEIHIPIYYREYNPDNAEICYQTARKLQVIKIRNDVLTWKKGEEVVYSGIGESELLFFLRDKKLEPSLAAQCCVVANEEKNKESDNPVKISKALQDIANTYVNESPVLEEKIDDNKIEEPSTKSKKKNK